MNIPTHDDTVRTVVSPVDSLTDALTSERRLIEDLTNVIRRQRTAVAEDNLQAVDDSVFATHRILVTLHEARRRRKALNMLIAHNEDLGIFTLEEVLGGRMTDALRIARDELHSAARVLSREVAINRRVLRGALSSGDAFARMLAGATTQSPVYARGGVNGGNTPEPHSQGPGLLDRRI